MLKENKIEFKRVLKKLKGWKRSQNFLEFSCVLRVRDNLERKKNNPFVSLSSDGVLDSYNREFGENSVEYDVLVTFLVLEGYFDESKFLEHCQDEKKDEFKYVFGQSRDELVKYMYEFNYKRETEDMYKINFNRI